MDDDGSSVEGDGFVRDQSRCIYFTPNTIFIGFAMVSETFEYPSKIGSREFQSIVYNVCYRIVSPISHAHSLQFKGVTRKVNYFAIVILV